MKKIILVAGLLALAACNKEAQPEQSEPETVQAVLAEDQSADNLPDQLNETAQEAPGTNAEEQAEEERIAAEEQAKQDEIDHPIELINPGSRNDIYVYRDRATGCEFIQFESNDNPTAMFPRPDGNGGQRGCRKGTDFVPDKRGS